MGAREGGGGYLCMYFVYVNLGLGSPGSSATAKKPRRPSSYQDKSRESLGLQIIFRLEIVLPNVQGEWRRMRCTAARQPSCCTCWALWLSVCLINTFILLP